MSLTEEDLQQLRLAIREEATSVIDVKLREYVAPLSGEIQALRNDIKEIYDMLADINKRTGNKPVLDSAFSDLSDKEQLLRLNDILLSTAKRLHIELPR